MCALLRRVPDLKCAEIEIAAVTIKAISDGQRHIGIAFREDEECCKLLHLAWHYKLRLDNVDATFYWVQHKIDEPRLYGVLAFCDLVIQANPTGIPYAFDSPNDCFDSETGRFLLGPSKKGLTCATFVLAIFHAVGLPLVDLSGWPEREDDSKWQQSILDLLKDRADKEHIDEVTKQVGAVRVRPEEVAGASAAEIHPIGFQAANALAIEILQQLNEADAAQAPSDSLN